MFKSLVFIVGLFISFSTFAEVMNVYIEKEIDDNNIIVVTAKGDRLLLEKWTLKFSPFLFEGKIFSADISPLWVKIHIEGKDKIKWSIEDHLGTVDLNAKADTTQPKAPIVQGYAIEIAHNDELFIINGETFKAKTYCLGWKKGEQVKFIEGSAYGACASAKLLNLNRGKTCDVWCE